ncbi:uncharacterized protein LOC144173886 [Haemaphysalis longicornis]
MTGSGTSKEPLLHASQTASNFNEDAFQRELRQLRLSRVHTYAPTIFARGGTVPTAPSRNSITITGQSLSRASVYDAAAVFDDVDDARATPTMSPEHMEPSPRTPEPRPQMTSPSDMDDTKPKR